MFIIKVVVGGGVVYECITLKGVSNILAPQNIRITASHLTTTVGLLLLYLIILS